VRLLKVPTHQVHAVYTRQPTVNAVNAVDSCIKAINRE
jgi:hypothetical protein